MIGNYLNTILPFYTSLDQQEYRRWMNGDQAGEGKKELLWQMPCDRVLPFQFTRAFSMATIDTVMLHCYENDNFVDITSYFDDDFSIHTVNGIDYITYYSALKLNTPMYGSDCSYLELIDSDGIHYYSECFRIGNIDTTLQSIGDANCNVICNDGTNEQICQ